jgi:cell division protein FtsB
MEPEPETKEGYQTVMDSIFGESQIEKVLSSYFDIKKEETPILETKNKMDFLRNKINKISQKQELKNLSVNETQMKAGLVLLEQYDNSTLIGRTNKNNLVFNINNREVKLTPNGRTI